MDLHSRIKLHQEIRKANISKAFSASQPVERKEENPFEEFHKSLDSEEIEKASKWKLGDVDPKYPNYFVAGFNPKGQPVWKSKSKHKDHEHHPDNKGKQTEVNKQNIKSLDKYSDEELENLHADLVIRAKKEGKNFKGSDEIKVVVAEKKQRGLYVHETDPKKLIHVGKPDDDDRITDDPSSKQYQDRVIYKKDSSVQDKVSDELKDAQSKLQMRQRELTKLKSLRQNSVHPYDPAKKVSDRVKEVEGYIAHWRDKIKTLESQDSNQTTAMDLRKKLKDSGLEVSPDEYSKKTVSGKDLPKGSIVIWGGDYQTHSFYDSKDNRVSVSKIQKVLKDNNIENLYKIQTEKYDPGSEKGWKVEAQYHYLLPQLVKDTD
jgi:hypothetical protein